MADIQVSKIPWKIVRYCLYTLAALLLLYVAINLLTPSNNLVVDQTILNRIDSLEKVNAELENKQAVLIKQDSILTSQVRIVEGKIEHVKEKTTIIREYYHEQSQAAANYTTTQIDSFLKTRYDY